jgi:hypothetical protein
MSASEAENLNESICFPLFTQQRTFLRTAALRQQRPVKNLVPPHGARTADKELLSALGPERNLTFVLLPRSQLSYLATL